MLNNIRKLSTRAFSFIALGLAVAIVVLAYLFSKAVFTNSSPPQEFPISVGLIASLIAGSPGILMIRRQEGLSYSGSKYVYGRKALVSGLVWLLTFSFPAILIILHLIQLIFLNQFSA
jgi:hypothetical protein